MQLYEDNFGRTTLSIHHACKRKHKQHLDWIAISQVVPLYSPLGHPLVSAVERLD